MTNTDSTPVTQSCYFCGNSINTENESTAFNVGWELLDNNQWACPHCVYINNKDGEY